MRGSDYFRKKIEEFEKTTPTPKANFYREYTSFLIDKMNNIQYTDAEDKTQDVTAFFANPERAIAKLREDRNLTLPLITVGIDDIDEDTDRRRGPHSLQIETVWDIKERRAVRVISRASKPINLTFSINIWSKYVEDLNQLVENIALLFNPSLDFQTNHSVNTKAFITQITDNSVLSVPDREDRVNRKMILVTAEAYLNYPKYLVTKTGEIETMTVDFEFSGYSNANANYRTTMALTGNSGLGNEFEYPDTRLIDGSTEYPFPASAGSTAYLDNVAMMSDGFSMLYNVYVPNSAGPHPLIIVTPGTGQYRNQKTYVPSTGFMKSSFNPRPGHYGEHLLAAGFAYATYDVRGQATTWSAAGGGGINNSYFYAPNLIDDPLGSGDKVPWEEFGAENFSIREILDVFEFKDLAVSGDNVWKSQIDQNSTGHMGGSLGGMAGGNVALHSGKTVPWYGISKSQEEFSAAGAASHGFKTDWGYTSSTKFSTFQAVAIESFFGRAEIFRNGDPPTRFGFLTGPYRMYELTTTAPRHLAAYETAIVSGSMNDFIAEMELRNPTDTLLPLTSVPAYMAFSYDDRQRGIDEHLDTFELYGGPKHFFGCTGHHSAPSNTKIQARILEESVDWFKYYIKNETSTSLPLSPYQFMISPSGIDEYQDPEHTRSFLNTSSVSSVNVSSIGYASTDGFNIYEDLIYTGTSSVDSVSALTDGSFKLKFKPVVNGFDVVGSPRSISSTSDFIEYLKFARGRIRISGNEFKNNLYGNTRLNSSMFGSIGPSSTDDFLIFGQVSGTFNITSVSAGLFAFDVFDISPGGGLRLMTTGSQAFDYPLSSPTKVNVKSRFCCYKLNKGHRIGLLIKNHPMFTPDIEDGPEDSTMEICPYFTRTMFTFDLEDSGCSIRVPMKDWLGIKSAIII
jgi:hypothetical protein